MKKILFNWANARCMMSKVVFSVVLTSSICLFSSCSYDLFTVQDKKIVESYAQIDDLQLYLDRDLKIERKVEENAQVDLSKGSLDIRGGEHYYSINFHKRLQGVAKISSSDKVVVQFDSDESAALSFKNFSSDNLFWLVGSIRGGKMYLTYEGEEYYVCKWDDTSKPAGEQARLLRKGKIKHKESKSGKRAKGLSVKEAKQIKAK